MATGADVSMEKPNNFKRPKIFDPTFRNKVKKGNGYTVWTLGAVKPVRCEGKLKIPFELQIGKSK